MVKLTDNVHTWYEPLPIPHRTADKAFWAMMGLSQLATVADNMNTQYALRKIGTQETNPLLKSRAALWGVTEGIWAAEIPWAWHYKRQDDALKAAGLPGHKYAKWWVIPLLNIGSHGLGISVTLASTHR